MTIRLTQLLILLLVAAAMGRPTLAQENVSAFMEPAARRMPTDYVTHFTSENRSFEVKLHTLVDAIRPSLASCSVEVIDPAQQRQLLTADEDGVVTISDAKEGLYILIASNASAHGCVVIACRETLAVDPDDGEVDIFNLDFEREVYRGAVSLMMMPVSDTDLQPILQNNFPEIPETPLDVLDSELIVDRITAPGHEYMIQLGTGGALRGRLISVVKPISRYSGRQGTVVVVFKDGKPVGKTTANALGQFQINGLEPGHHGLVVAGRGGYAAFGFDAVESKGLLERPINGRGFSYAQLMNDGEIIPVVLVPPTVLSYVSEAIASIYRQEAKHAEETEVLLAQKSGLDKEDRQTLESVRKSFAEGQTVENAKQDLAARTRPTIVETNPPQPSRTMANTNHSAKRAVKPRADIPVNPLRVAGQPGTSEPFNPLRAH